MTETKSYTISVTGALWQLLPTEFPSSICFPTNSTPLPKHNNNIFHNHKGIYQSHFHFAIGTHHDNVTMSNMHKWVYKYKKGAQSQSQVVYYSTLWYSNPPLNCRWKSTLAYIPFIGWSFLHNSDMRISCGSLKREAVALKGFARWRGRIGGVHGGAR